MRGPPLSEPTCRQLGQSLHFTVSPKEPDTHWCSKVSTILFSALKFPCSSFQLWNHITFVTTTGFSVIFLCSLQTLKNLIKIPWEVSDHFIITIIYSRSLKTVAQGWVQPFVSLLSAPLGHFSFQIYEALFLQLIPTSGHYFFHCNQ